jgi:integrase
MPTPFKNSSGIFYVRLKLPKELWPTAGREYKRSLGTRDPAIAKRKFPQALVAAQEAIALAKAQLAGAEVLTDSAIEQLAANWYHDETATMEARRSFADWLNSEEHSIERPGGVEHVTVYSPWREGSNEEDEDEAAFDALAARFATKALKQSGFPLPPDASAAAIKLRAQFREAMLKVSDLAYERVQGKWLAAQDVLPVAPVPKGSGRGDSAEGMLYLFEGYASERILNEGDNRATRKTLAAYRRIVGQFVELCDNPSLANMGRQTIQNFRAQLVKLPARGAGTRKMDAKRLIQKAEAENLPRVSAATVRNKLLAISAVCTYGVRLGKLSENPVQVSGIGRAAKKAANLQAVRKRRRKHYTREEIARIFTSPIYRDGWIAPKNFGLAWVWMPLLLYYTGARREELAQLRVKDVPRSAGGPAIPHLSILASDDDDEGRGVKTEGSRRLVPLHPDLIARGFLEYVESLPPGGSLFPALTANPQGFYGANFGKRWGTYVREAVGIEGVSPSHGFRHTFKTFAREVGISEEVHDAITGHVGGGRVGRGYGEMPLQRMFEELKKYPLALTPESDGDDQIQGL